MTGARVELVFLTFFVGLSSLYLPALGHGKAIRSSLLNPTSSYGLAARNNLTAYTNGLLRASVQQALAM